MKAGLAVALRETVWGELDASSVITKFAVRWPGPTGLNTSEIVQFAVGATGAVQLLVRLKSDGLGPARETADTCSGAVPVLSTVSVCGAPAVPSVMVGKEGTVGEKTIAGDGAIPVPFKARVCGLPGALSATWNAADKGPAVAGMKVMLMEQLPLGARVAKQVLDCEKLEAFAPAIEMELMERV